MYDRELLLLSSFPYSQQHFVVSLASVVVLDSGKRGEKGVWWLMNGQNRRDFIIVPKPVCLITLILVIVITTIPFELKNKTVKV